MVSPDGKEATLEPVQISVLGEAFVSKFTKKTQEITTILQDRGVGIINQDLRSRLPLGKASTVSTRGQHLSYTRERKVWTLEQRRGYREGEGIADSCNGVGVVRTDVKDECVGVVKQGREGAWEKGLECRWGV